MNILLNPGSKWGIKIFFLQAIITFLFIGINKILMNFMDVVPDLITNLPTMSGIPVIISWLLLCGSWNPGIFGRCTTNDNLNFIIASVMVFIFYMIIGSFIYLIVKKIKTR